MKFTGLSFPALVAFGLCLLPAFPAQAEVNDHVTKKWVIEFDSERFLDMAGITVTQTDMDAYLLRMAPERRPAFLASAERLSEALTNIVLIQAFSPLAKKEGLLEDPVAQARLYQVLAREVREIYREWYLESIELEDYTVRARELYLTNPERFREPETVDFRHILVLTDGRRAEVDAMATVIDAHEALSNGADFAEVAEQYSDDPSAPENGGLFEGVKTSDLLQQVAVILGQTGIGEISDPVRSRHGWHVVRLEAVHEGEIPEWEDVRDRAIRIARERHHTEAFERLLRSFQDDGYEFAEGSVAELLVRYGVVDEDDPPTQDQITPLLIDD